MVVCNVVAAGLGVEPHALDPQPAVEVAGPRGVAQAPVGVSARPGPVARRLARSGLRVALVVLTRHPPRPPRVAGLGADGADDVVPWPRGAPVDRLRVAPAVGRLVAPVGRPPALDVARPRAEVEAAAARGEPGVGPVLRRPSTPHPSRPEPRGRHAEPRNVRGTFGVSPNTQYVPRNSIKVRS